MCMDAVRVEPKVTDNRPIHAYPCLSMSSQLITEPTAVFVRRLAPGPPGTSFDSTVLDHVLLLVAEGRGRSLGSGRDRRRGGGGLPRSSRLDFFSCCVCGAVFAAFAQPSTTTSRAVEVSATPPQPLANGTTPHPRTGLDSMEREREKVTVVRLLLWCFCKDCSYGHKDHFIK